MRHSKANISIFIPHIGCPHMCSFCDQRTISGEEKAPRPQEVREICSKALAEVGSPEDTEIAFFGGSFTAIPEKLMIDYLKCVQDFLGEGKFFGIRISTRPDYINNHILDILRDYGVTSIELGAQSMNDGVLLANGRGHTAQDVYRASDLIKSYGFELGLQMMVGLYRSTEEIERETVDRICEIHPDTVRIYPVVILKNTELDVLYKSGEYRLLSFETVTEIVADAMERFMRENIRVIKCGLHASELVERDMTGGFYHPALREICESLIYRRKIESLIGGSFGRFNIFVNPSCISKAIGQKRSNVEYFGQRGIEIRVKGDGRVAPYECVIGE